MGRVREAALEVWVEFRCAAAHEPGSIAVLGREQVRYAFLVGSILRRDAHGFGEGEEALTGSIGVAGQLRPLRPPAIGALPGQNGLGQFLKYPRIHTSPTQTEQLHVAILRVPRP